jgi:hypothetical protein
MLQNNEGTIGFVIVFDEEPNDTALLSESSLADWNRPEEDAAWAYLTENRP